VHDGQRKLHQVHQMFALTLYPAGAANPIDGRHDEVRELLGILGLADLAGLLRAPDAGRAGAAGGHARPLRRRRPPGACSTQRGLGWHVIPTEDGKGVVAKSGPPPQTAVGSAHSLSLNVSSIQITALSSGLRGVDQGTKRNLYFPTDRHAHAQIRRVLLGFSLVSVSAQLLNIC